MSVLRIELRRTVAPWLVFLLLAVGLPFFFLFSGPWWKDAQAWDLQWTPSVLWSRYALSLLWPIIVAAAAIQGMRDRRSGMDELLSTTPRPAAHRTAQAGFAIGLSAVVGFLVLVVVGLAQVIVHDGLFGASWVLPLLAGIASVLAGLAVGLAAGRLLPHPLTAPAAGVAALAVTVVLQTAGAGGSAVQQRLPNWLSLLSPAAAQPRSAYVVPAVSVSVGQLCWFLGLAASGFLVLAVRRWFAVLPGVVGVAVAIALFPASAAGNSTVDAEAAALVCDGPVCVTTLHAGWLSTVSGPGKAALARLAKLPSAPSRIVETTESEYVSHPGATDPATLVVRRDSSSLRGLSGQDLEFELLATGPSCSGLAGELAARYVVASWLLGDLRPLPHANVFGPVTPGLVRDAWTRLRALPAGEQFARVSAARQAQQSCTGDPYALLVGKSR
ncbi:hypothetical protein [Amycolatopsis sp. FDAARGOS 1241]|uniref:hypothetical protein n=1 Tax=Amycolatopsis sp. FDAARGOS 1241 TaxID=2778070 RepID=UPI001951C606|nr:hypothetical protein [Amycolatopsis sp. FDAARGOS 1241]QRP47039.1 hypothetical protein I6J71_03135 [Amycolatopsis sp. FDAARGOS 1241]